MIKIKNKKKRKVNVVKIGDLDNQYVLNDQEYDCYVNRGITLSEYAIQNMLQKNIRFVKKIERRKRESICAIGM